MAITNQMSRKGLARLAFGSIDWQDASPSTMKAYLVLESMTGTNFRNTYTVMTTVATFKATDTDAKAVDPDDPDESVSGKLFLTTSNQSSITFSTAGSSDTQTVGGIAIFKSSGTDATSIPFCLNDFTSTLVTNGSDVQVTFNASGVVKFSM